MCLSLCVLCGIFWTSLVVILNAVRSLQFFGICTAVFNLKSLYGFFYLKSEIHYTQSEIFPAFFCFNIDDYGLQFMITQNSVSLKI